MNRTWPVESSALPMQTSSEITPPTALENVQSAGSNAPLVAQEGDTAVISSPSPSGGLSTASADAPSSQTNKKARVLVIVSDCLQDQILKNRDRVERLKTAGFYSHFCGSLESTNRAAKTMLTNTNAFYKTLKFEASMTEIMEFTDKNPEGVWEVVADDMSFKEMYQQRELPCVRVTFARTSTAWTARSYNVQSGMKGRTTTNSGYLKKMKVALTISFGDSWRGLIRLLDTQHQLCLECREVIKETPGKWYDISKLVNHFHEHAEMAARSEETKALCQAKVAPPPPPTCIPDAILTEAQLKLLKETPPTPAEHSMFWACLGQIFDIEDPVWPHSSIDIDTWKPKKRYGVIISTGLKRDRTRERLLARNRKLQKEEERKEQARKKAENEEKKKAVKKAKKTISTPKKSAPKKAASKKRKRSPSTTSSSSSSSSTSSSSSS